jgi:hypothetical protein
MSHADWMLLTGAALAACLLFMLARRWARRPSRGMLKRHRCQLHHLELDTMAVRSAVRPEAPRSPVSRLVPPSTVLPSNRPGASRLLAMHLEEQGATPFVDTQAEPTVVAAAPAANEARVQPLNALAG